MAAAQLQRTAQALRCEFPSLEVQPVIADYTHPFELPVPQHEWRHSLVFFPGSAIGNFEPSEARVLLSMLGRIAGDDRLLLLGADGTRDLEVLARAYDDDRGLTAAFDRNVLLHINRTHGATFDPNAFEHRAVPVVTEHCYKHTPEALRALLATGGWRPRQVFTSPRRPYRLWLCEPLTWMRSRG